MSHHTQTPCPFCLSHNLTGGYESNLYCVACEDCGARGPRLSDPATAIRAWEVSHPWHRPVGCPRTDHDVLLKMSNRRTLIDERVPTCECAHVSELSILTSVMILALGPRETMAVLRAAGRTVRGLDIRDPGTA